MLIPFETVVGLLRAPSFMAQQRLFTSLHIDRLRQTLPGLGSRKICLAATERERLIHLMRAAKFGRMGRVR
jgi:hypothetical protein